MTSSSYCELVLRVDGVERFQLVVQKWEIPLECPRTTNLPGNRSVELTLRRGGAASLLRVRLENDEILRLPPERGRPEWTVQLGELLREQYGLADLVVEEAPVYEQGDWSPVLSVTIKVETDPAFQRLHEALVKELEEVHLALARDVVGRSWLWRRGSGEMRSLSVNDDLHKLEELYVRFERALDRIGEQPSRALRRRRILSRWRPGDNISTLAAHRLALDENLRRDRDGRIVGTRKALLERVELATDIEEHRHTRSGLVRLADRSAALSRYCRRAINLLEEDKGRWSEQALEHKTLPRIESLERIQERAERLQEKFRRLVSRQPFLAAAGSPRTPLGPTPIFLGRPAYRETYRALMEARRYVGGRFDPQNLRVRFRNLATIYEYWLFVKVVGLLREMYGAPEGNRAFSLIDEIYRPELAPGQQFLFLLPRGDRLTATYEPDFPPVATRSPARFRSSLVSAPLRPDVTIELSVPGHQVVMLALDAKSGPRFRGAQERLQGTANYLWLVHDPQTGHQPVRQLFLVHRDPGAAPVCNMVGYLEGRVSPPDARVLGAVSAWPGNVHHLRNIIRRFLETFRDRRRR